MRTGLIILLLFSAALVQAQTGDVVYLPGSTVKIDQLVGEYDRERQAPTLNLTESRYRLVSTDLGVPFRHNGRTWLLFGDTSGPVGGDAIAYTSDTNPEDGIELTFIHDTTGTYKPVHIPGLSQGAFEVPMEGVSVGGKMYIYHTTDHSNSVVMGRSVVAVSGDNGQTFTYLYDLSRRHFINVSVVAVDLADWDGFPQDTGNGLVLFGSGRYRQSEVRLAFQPADSIETPQGLRYFTGFDEAGMPQWSAREEDASRIFGISQPCVGEFSVSYNRFLQKWLMLYNCDEPRGINFRAADTPWGPWSEPQVLFDPWLDNGYCHFIHVDWQFRQCDSVHDPGRENGWGGEYGPYQFEHLAIGNDSTTTIYFTMSTWNPYTVVLMKSTLRLSLPTSVENEVSQPPSRFRLWQNYPNPFTPLVNLARPAKGNRIALSNGVNATTTIRFLLPEREHITLQVFDVFGREVATLVDGELTAGVHAVTFDAKNLAGGVYIYRLISGQQVLQKKMIVVK